MRELKSILIAASIVAGASGAVAQSPPAPSSPIVTVHGHHLAFHVFPGRLPVLVLDAGGGNDSSYWQSIVAKLSKRTGSEIVTYDRAGSGASDEVKPPFHLENAVDDLEGGLKQLGATHDLILVPHSLAGEIATYFAIRHPEWVSGAVLVDANVPNFFTDRETDTMYRMFQPQIASMLTAHPSKQARTVAAMMPTYIETNRAFHKAHWPLSIPCIVIVSEKPPLPPGPQAALWTQAHIDFAKGASNRTLVIAKGSSHDVAHDRPDVIVDAIGELVDRARAKNPALAH